MSATNSDIAAFRDDSAATLRRVVNGHGPLFRSFDVLSSEMAFVLNTGIATEPEKWRERKLREQELEAQTERLADILERYGIPAYSKSSTTYAVGLVTGHIEPLQRFRTIRFLPIVAKRERAPLLNEVRLFRQCHPSHRDYLRFGVLTCGPRIPIGAEGELRSAFTILHRKVSRWAQWADRKYGIEVILRSSEFTVHDETSGQSVHPHANVLYTPRSRLTKRQFRQFLKETNERFGAWWKDCGILHSPEEAIKYVSKPADLETLADAEIVWLFNETYRLKFAQPLGSFANWRKDTLCEHGEKGWHQVRKVVSVHTPQGNRLSVVTKKRRDHVERLEPTSDEIGQSKPTCYMGFTLPQRRVTPFAEPYALIRTDLDVTSLDVTEFLRQWQNESNFGDTSDKGFQEFIRTHKAARKTWDTNNAPKPEAALRIGGSLINASKGKLASLSRFIVHTCRPTARPDNLETSLNALENCLHDTERITTTYSDLELDSSIDSDDADFGGAAAIRRIPSGITPLHSSAAWSPC